MKYYSICNYPSGFILEEGPLLFKGSILPKPKKIPDFFLNNKPVKVKTRCNNSLDYETLNEAKFSSKKKLKSLDWAFDYVIDANSWNKRGVVELEIKQSNTLIGRHCWRMNAKILQGKLPLTIFLHMPKCAGTSIRVQFDNYYNILNSQVIYPSEINDQTNINIAKEIKPNSNVICGHYKFGLHKGLKRRARYLTILRAPFEFVVSQYFHAKLVIKNEKIAKCESLTEAIRIAPNMFDNIFTRWISNCPDNKMVTKSNFLRACSNINKFFDIIGFVDSMEKTNKLLSRYFGVPFNNTKSNVTPVSSERKLLNEKELKNSLNKLIFWDKKLYKFAKKYRNVFEAKA